MDDSNAVVVTESKAAAQVRQSHERAAGYIQHSKAESTLRAYRSDWEGFTAWCKGRGLVPLPAAPQTVALFLADSAQENKPATLARRLAAISKAHQAAGHESPASMKHAAVSEVWKGIKRVHGTAQEQKAPVLVSDMRRMVASLDESGNEILALRDRALLLVGYAGAFRRSELVGLDVEDVQFTVEGLVVTLRRSKTDQEGQGRSVAVPYGSSPSTCPVRSLRAWLDAAGISTGSLFRSVNRHGHVQLGRLSDKAVALVVKRQADAVGIDASKYAGHSLRAGLVTEAARAGVSDRVIMQTTGHRSRQMVDRYVRAANLFKDNAASRIGL